MSVAPLPGVDPLAATQAVADTRTSNTRRAPSTAENPSGSGGSGASDADQLKQLETQFSQSDFNAQKVQDIQNAISQGKYSINAGAIADGLLRSAGGLAGVS